VSWVYDSPIHIRDLSSLNHSCNEIYFFDRGQAESHRKDGVDARHMPLAADTELLKKAIRSASGSMRQGSRVDISLVGKLYQTEYPYFTAPLDDYLKGFLEGIVNAQIKLYGAYLIPELLTDDLLTQMNRIYRKVSTDGFIMGRRELEFLLASETTGRERFMALSLLANHFPVDLYSDQNDRHIQKVRYRGYADYETQMPCIFASSKINLNISLKTIRTGIPLRVLDIMGCGGFVLTNYQEEIAEDFLVGEECAVYESLEDLYEKAAYYLSHESEREKTAAAGYERVKRDFTFRDRIQRMLG
jgi:spore maturation protein CgeB